MKGLYFWFKDFVVEILWLIKRNVTNDLKLKEVVTSGLSVTPGRVSLETCEELRTIIDKMIDDDGVKKDEGAALGDKRVYGAENIYPWISEVVDIQSLVNMAHAYTGTRPRFYTILCARIEAVGGVVGSGGGWHRDSPFSHQFKAIFYLNDVDEMNGPFCYLIGSHLNKDKNKYYHGGSRSIYRFDTELIKSRLDEVYQVVGSAGTAVYVDTRGIHCGAPLKSGVRYALTVYFWNTKPRSEFFELAQGRISTI